MQSICGYLRLDDAPVPTEAGRRFVASQCPNPAMVPECHVLTGPRATFGYGMFGGWSMPAGEALLHDTVSGCTVVADARLDECSALARELGIADGDKLPSTAQLILAAWLKWGEGCADHLRGDFAFGIHDARKRQLYLARDIMGVRPLNVHYAPGKRVAFATRALSLPMLPDVPDTLNEGRIADALVTQLEGIDKRCTFFEAVERLPPAHWASFTPEGKRESCYWQPAPGRVAIPKGDDEWAEALTAALEAAVANHLRGPARVGCMLSGGMDSSSLAVIAADQLAAAGRGKLPTFSSVDAAAAPEETRAVQTLSHLPCFAATVLTPEAVAAGAAAHATAAWCSDEPFDAPFAVPRTQYLHASRAGIDALIDGALGDIVFASGDVLARQLRQCHWIGFWRNLRGELHTYPAAASSAYFLAILRMAYSPTSVRRWAHGWRTRRNVEAADTLASGVVRQDFAERIGLGDRFKRLRSWSPTVAIGDERLEAVTRLAHPRNIVGTERYYRIAAWSGVDMRSPLSDRAVVELSAAFPDRQRARDGWSKAILRDAMKGRLPEPVRTRRDKQHPGSGLIDRLLLGDRDAARSKLDAVRERLEPYVDWHALDRAFENWDNPAALPGRFDTLLALALGRWLLVRGGVTNRVQDSASRHAHNGLPRGVIP